LWLHSKAGRTLHRARCQKRSGDHHGERPHPAAAPRRAPFARPPVRTLAMVHGRGNTHVHRHRCEQKSVDRPACLATALCTDPWGRSVSVLQGRIGLVPQLRGGASFSAVGSYRQDTRLPPARGFRPTAGHAPLRDEIRPVLAALARIPPARRPPFFKWCCQKSN